MFAAGNTTQTGSTGSKSGTSSVVHGGKPIIPSVKPSTQVPIANHVNAVVIQDTKNSTVKRNDCICSLDVLCVGIVSVA